MLRTYYRTLVVLVDTIEKELEEMAKYHDLLEILSTYFPKDYDGKDTKELING